jgi:hypothetical protein
MIKKIVKFCITAIIAFLLAIAAWYFCLVKIPEEALVQGTAAPSLSREQGQALLHHHGVKTAYIKDGYWYFRRDGEDCRLMKKQ